jgi:hypothetical protein
MTPAVMSAAASAHSSQGAGFAGDRGAVPPEPSWPTVIATTIRLWLERHPIVVGGKTIRIRPQVSDGPE